MKTGIIAILFLLAGVSQSFAHYIWLETSPSGALNTSHDVKIRFGEYTYGVIEKVNSDAFKSVSDFSVWVVSPSGKKTSLKTTPKDDHYLASFVPAEQGTYTIALDNKKMNVLDYSQYDMGILKPQYHCKAKVVIGKSTSETKNTNAEGIEINDLSIVPFGVNAEVKLQILFRGKPLPKNEVTLSIDDRWTKKLWTEEDGTVSFKLPWNTLYTVEATYNEKTPGNYNGKDYEYIWHCATYCIKTMQ